MNSSELDSEHTLPTQNDIPAVTDGCVVWHCRQLRTGDHPAIEYASREYDQIMPLFVFDPSFYSENGLACDARIRFMHESLRDLSSQYADRGGELTLAHGDPIEVLSACVSRGWDVVTTADPTGRYGLRRDNQAAETCDVTFIDADGIVREADNTREDWREKVETWLTADQCEWDASDVQIRSADTVVSVDRIEQAYDISPQKDISRRGGTTAAGEVIETFLSRLSSYPGNISAPSDARTGTSQLSPYLRFGCVSVRQVYQAIEANSNDTRAKTTFKSRLYWNRHYNQKLADWSGWMDTAVNPVLEDFHQDTHDPTRVTAWKEGQTGYPIIDASMRCLKETGWLNFRMRATCASFFADLLQQPWKIGADWYYYHLLDADPAINYTQFQMHAGVDGTSMMQIYNPRKQVRDNDADGEFIQKWVPELADLPAEHLDRPEKAPIHVQRSSGVSIGDDYPYPVVNYERARERIVEKIEAVRPQAKQALDHPEVARRASVSGRTGGTSSNSSSSSNIPDRAESQQTNQQSSLAQFE